MSIKRLLVLAGLLAIGACHPGPTGPNGLCPFEPNFDGDTQETVCTSDPGTPVSPGDNLSATSAQR
jgi:predicted small lipoprotein YifL